MLGTKSAASSPMITQKRDRQKETERDGEKQNQVRNKMPRDQREKELLYLAVLIHN